MIATPFTDPWTDQGNTNNDPNTHEIIKLSIILYVKANSASIIKLFSISGAMGRLHLNSGIGIYLVVHMHMYH